MKIRTGAAAVVASGLVGAVLAVVTPAPAQAATFDLVGSSAVHGRVINLWRKTSGGVGLHGQIKGVAGDQVWLENWWGQKIGTYTIPNGGTEANTDSIGAPGNDFRACGKAGDRPDVVCTGYGEV